MLFLCAHNAGRSQMALGWFNHLAGGRAVAWSGGSEPGTEINPSAVAAMAEVGIDITSEFPKPWTDEIIRAADVVITMGCGDACPLHPGKRYEDWELDDPAGQDVTAVRPIRDQIRARVEILLSQLTPTTMGQSGRPRPAQLTGGEQPATAFADAQISSNHGRSIGSRSLAGWAVRSVAQKRG